MTFLYWKIIISNQNIIIMKKQILNIKDLKVNSFITEAEKNIVGGREEATTGCQTVKVTGTSHMTLCDRCPVAIDTV